MQMPLKRPYQPKTNAISHGYQMLFISSSSYQRKIAWGIASKPRVQRDPCRASGHMDPEVASWNCSLGRCCRPSAFLGDGRDRVADDGSGLVAGVVLLLAARGMGLARIRLHLGHRPCRLAHRTPVLYSRNQSRTNIAP